MQQVKRNEFDTLVQADNNNRHQAVLKAASELFASKEDPSWEDALHFEELCLRLMPKLNLQAKSEIAERLAHCSALPKTTALTLAKDDIAVAAPILHHYAGFNDTDLLTIIARGTELHALAIAGRPNLSDAVMLVISKKALPTFQTNIDYDELRSDPTTIEVTIVDNSSQLEQSVEQESNDDVHSEITAVPERSMTDRTMTEPSDHENKARLDIDVDMEQTAQRLIAATKPKTGISLSGKDTSARISGLDRFLAMEHAHVLTHVHTAVENASDDKVNPALILKQAYRRADRARDFTQLAREKNVEQFAALLTRECDLPEDDAKSVINDDHGFALAICLKSLALPKHVANEAFLLLNPKLGKDQEQIYLLNWFYGQITPMAAHSVIEEWHPAMKTPGSVEHKPVYSGKSRTEKAQGGFAKSTPTKIEDTVQRSVVRR
ncbi:MAG: DUF2336 domain-containing protein [Hyphomicrobiales bacterium]